MKTRREIREREREGKPCRFGVERHRMKKEETTPSEIGEP